MKFKEYLEQLNNFAKENPESLNMEVIYASDDEGNSFNPVIYSPSKGRYEDGEYRQDKEPTNVVCIN